MLYQLNYIHRVWDCKCKAFFRFCKIYFVTLHASKEYFIYGKT